MGTESIRGEEAVSTTLRNLVDTLSVKLDSAARYEQYQEDARRDGIEECGNTFAPTQAAADVNSDVEVGRVALARGSGSYTTHIVGDTCEGNVLLQSRQQPGEVVVDPATGSGPDRGWGRWKTL